jgi:hypothetical protein
MLGHPIVTEYIKTYDIIANFKNLITKSLPNNTSESDESFLVHLYDKLNQMQMIDFDNEALVTPQIVDMTTSIDSTLNEIQIIFNRVIDEFITLRYDLIERDQQLSHLKQQLRPIRSGSLTNMKKHSPLSDSFENEQRLQLKILGN